MGTAYTSSDEHLWDELARIDQLVRAQTNRWRKTTAAAKPDRLWGMVHVSDAEVAAYMSSPFIRPDEVSAELESHLSSHWTEAERRAGEIAERSAETPPSTSRLTRLRLLFDLDDLHRDLLLACLLPELDERYRRLYGYLQDDASRNAPSLALLRELLHPVASPAAVHEAVSSGSPLVDHGLIVVGGDAGGIDPPATRPVRVDDRISGYLLGGDSPDLRVAGGLAFVAESLSWDDVLVDGELVARLRSLAIWARDSSDGRRPDLTLFLHGPYGSGRLTAAKAFCNSLEKPLLVADAAAAQRLADGWERTVNLIFREAMLRDAALYWNGCETLLASEQTAERWQRLLERAESFAGVTFLAAESAWDPTGRFRDRPFLRLDFRPPPYPLRVRLWGEHLPAEGEFEPGVVDREELIEQLANGFQLTQGQTLDAVATARALAMQRDPDDPKLTPEDLFEGCRRQSYRGLETFTRRIEPRTELTFDDLVLPPASERQLRELRSRISNRNRVFAGLGFERRVSLGRGLIAMFTGTTGTGKTMAAELLAREQGVDLYKVDLSAVVSKYVGETEKNLAGVFADAEDANAIIFFDEADALFGKRGEVQDARDRWANIEINYLLQRVEEYAGVVILASNLRQNIDDAFMRRIHVVVEFPFPDIEARFRIWRGMFPPEIERPTDDELSELATRFQLAGGSTKNIVVDAAFRALADAVNHRPRITLRHLVLATVREYQKLGRPITPGEFGQTFYDWAAEDLLSGAVAD